MKKNKHIFDILQLNLAVLIISTSGVLGRFIEMAPPLTIWMRSALGALFLGIFCWHQKVNLKLKNKNDFVQIAIGGILMALHWITYFYSLQLSNVAIAMLSLFTHPIITVFLEPLFLKTKLQARHLPMGVLVLLGIYFLTPEFDVSNSYTQGIVLGLFSALSYSIRNILMKKQASHYPGSTLMFYQIGIVSLLMWPTLFYFDAPSDTGQWSAVIALALITTAIGHTLFIMSFKNFSISTVSIISSIQPIYGIILGILFLAEIPGINSIIGGALIVSTVVIESLRSSK